MISENTASLLGRPLARHQWIAFAFLAVLFLLSFKTMPLLVIALCAFLALPPLLYLVFKVLDGNAEPVMLLWAGIFPLGYYFLLFPRTQAIITFNRVVVLLLAAAILFCPRDRVTRIPDSLRRSAWAWAAFLAAALLSLVSVTRVFGRVAWCLEALLFPGLLGWYVVACFPVRRYLRSLHAIICVVAVYCAAIGAAEMALGIDLLPIPGAGEYLAGNGGVTVLRVNGPFSSNNSFGLIGLATFCLLGFLRQALGNPLPRWQRVLNALGVAGALLQAMMPLFRSIFITITVIFIMDMFRQLSWRQKAARIGALSAIGVTILVVMFAVPELFEERISSPGNIYARIAQQKQNFRIFLDAPILGVGMWNFADVAASKPAFTASYEGVGAPEAPHSNLGAVLAETGLAGFVPFCLSQCFLVFAFWKLRRLKKKSGKLAWTFFLYIFLSYWISGLALASAYYSDLNLWFLFCLAVIYKYAITEGAVQANDGHTSGLAAAKAGI